MIVLPVECWLIDIKAAGTSVTTVLLTQFLEKVGFFNNRTWGYLGAFRGRHLKFVFVV